MYIQIGTSGSVTSASLCQALIAVSSVFPCCVCSRSLLYGHFNTLTATTPLYGLNQTEVIEEMMREPAEVKLEREDLAVQIKAIEQILEQISMVRVPSGV